MRTNEDKSVVKDAILAAVVAELEAMGKEPQVRSIVNFNDEVCHFIAINDLRVEDGDSNRFPTPTVCFEEFLEGLEVSSFAVNAKVLAGRIVELISDAILNESKFPSQVLLNENELPLLVPALCDKELNKKFLSDKPHIDVGNGFALFLREVIAAGEGRFSSSVSYEELRDVYGITEKEAFEKAFVEIERADASEFFSVVDVLMQGSSRRNLLTEENPVCPDEPIPMYVLTDRLCGSATLYRPGLREQVAEILNDDFYVIPSSTHELIIMPSRMVELSEGELEAMARNVIQNYVSSRDVLSCKVQMFSRKLGKLISCTENPRFS